MELLEKIQDSVISYLRSEFGLELSKGRVVLSETKKEFEGDSTLVVFPFVKMLKMSPEQAAQNIGEHLIAEVAEIESYNVVKGFLNLVFSDQYWLHLFDGLKSDKTYGQWEKNGKKVLVEYASPNTNKPLHLGHIRNVLLGWSCANILEKAGYEVVRTQVVNDRGIAICKSMLAWKLFGEGATPQSTGIKSDHFVGDYYVLFEKKFKEEYQTWQSSVTGQKVFESEAVGEMEPAIFFRKYKNQYFNDHSFLGKEARKMLLAWEDKDAEVRELWSQMNGWVYDGFDVTYHTLGINFDLSYYESETYLLGREFILEGVDKGIFYKKPDGSVWVNLESSGLDEKILLRADGTSVYMTQDLGTAHIRYKDHGVDQMVYVVANEQNYHFQALFEILKRLEEPYANGLYHLAYGMVDLPSGKMKSREGTVVDADDLIEEIISEAKQSSDERGELVDLEMDEQVEIIKRIGLAALKFFILKVNPKKRMVFDPKESLDLQGQTGPYIQNAYVRIRSVFRKSDGQEQFEYQINRLESYEKELIKLISTYPDTIKEAAEKYDPSVIAHYAYELAKNFHRFYHHMRILNAETENLRNFRLQLIKKISIILEELMRLLGIQMPERM